MHKLSLTIFIFLIFFIFSISLAQTGKHLVTFDQLFTKIQQQQMGLYKLTESEKEALHSHVEELLVKALASSNESTTQSIKNNPTDNLYIGVGGKHWIKKNVDSGTYMVLEDDSLWQIDPIDKINAMLWLPVSNITVTKSTSGSPGYEYLLVNTDDGEKAHAKYMGRN